MAQQEFERAMLDMVKRLGDFFEYPALSASTFRGAISEIADINPLETDKGTVSWELTPSSIAFVFTPKTGNWKLTVSLSEGVLYFGFYADALIAEIDSSVLQYRFADNEVWGNDPLLQRCLGLSVGEVIRGIIADIPVLRDYVENLPKGE